MRGCAGDRGGGAGRAGRPVLQSLSPINITSENEVIIAARQSGKTLPQLQEDFLFPLFNCSSVLPPTAPPLPIHVLRPPCTWAEAGCWMHCSSGEAGEVAAACPRASPVLGETPAAAVGSALPLWSCGHGKEVAAELLLAASGQPQQAHPIPRSDGEWQGQELCPYPPLGHLFRTVMSAQCDRQKDFSILSPRIWKSLKMEVFRVNIYPKLVLHQHLPGLQ